MHLQRDIAAVQQDTEQAYHSFSEVRRCVTPVSASCKKWPLSALKSSSAFCFEVCKRVKCVRPLWSGWPKVFSLSSIR